MKKLIFTSLAFITLANFAFAQIPDCSDLFISEYLEGTGKNRVLEIYNPTFEDIDLSEYSVKVFASGPNNPNVMPLSGNLPAKEVLVCGHDQADSGILLLCDITSSELKFDGDDAVGLYKNDVLIDMIGEIGVNPGNTGWQVGIGFTKDNTLRRHFDVREGTPYWSISVLQWDVSPLDEVSGLGNYDNACALGTVFFTEGQQIDIVEDDITVFLNVFVDNPDSSAIIIQINHPNGYNCLDPMDYATFGANDDYTTPFGQPIMVQVPGLSNGNIGIAITIIEDNIAEPDDEAICFRLVPGPGYIVPQDQEFKYKTSLIILDDGDVTGIEERVEKTLKVYPTVANKELFVETKKYAGQMEIMIYNVFGQEMKRQTISEIKAMVEIGNLANGIYVLQAIGDGWKVDRLFIKN